MITSLSQSHVFYHIISNLEGRYTAVNINYRNKFIATDQNLSTYDPTEHLDATTLQHAYVAQQKILSGSSASEIVNLKKKKLTGELIWTEWEFLPVFDELQTIIGVSCIGYDVPNYVEHALEQSNYMQQIINNFADSSSAQISLKDENLNYLSCNRQMVYDLNLEKNEIYLKNDSHFYDAAVAKQIIATDLQALELEMGTILETQLQINNKFYRSQKFPVLLKNGLNGVGCITIDTTEKENYAREIIDKETVLKNLTNNLNVSLGQFRMYNLNTIKWEFSSNEISNIIGVTIDEINTDPFIFHKMLTADQVVHLNKALLHSYKTQVPLNIELHLLTRLKGYKWIEIIASATKQQDKSVLFSAVFKDVTYQKNLEKEVTNKELFLQNLTDNINGVVTQFRTKNKVPIAWEFVSRRISEIYELTFETLQQNPLAIRDLIPADELEVLLHKMYNSVENLSARTYQHTIKTATGKTKWIEFTALPKVDYDDCVVWYGFHQDITQRKLLEQQNTKNQKLLTNLTNNIDGAIIQVRHFKINEPIWEFVSAGIEQLFEITAEHLFANPLSIRRMVAPEQQQRYEKEIEISFNNGTTIHFTMQIITPSGLHKWIRLKSTPTKQKNGSCIWRGFYENVTETKLLEIDNKKNQNLLSNLTNNIDVVLSQINYIEYEKPNWQYVSKGVEKLYEISFTDLKKDPYLVRNMTTYDAFEQIKKQIISGKQIGRILTEFEITTPSGVKKWIQTSVIPKYEKKNGVTVFAFHIDITTKKELENKIIANEQFLKSLTNNVNGMLTQLQVYNDTTIKWNFLSDGVEKLYEISRDEVYNNPFALFETINKADYEKAKLHFLNCQKRNKFYFSQHRITTKKGNEKWIEVNSTPNQQEDGSTIWNGFHHDITEQKKLELKNAQTQKQLDFIVNNTVSALILIEENQIAYVSKNYQAIFGFTIEEEMTVIVNSIWKLVHFDDERELIKKQAFNALKKQDKNVLLQYQYLHKNGKIIWRQDRINIFYNKKGRATKVVNIVSDITKTKRLENLVRRKNEQLALQIIEKEKVTENFVAFQNSKWQEIAANLHDNISQLLFAANLHLSNFTNEHTSYEKAKDIIQIALNEIKYITQATKNLVIQDKGLQKALKEFIENNNYLNNIKITKIAHAEFYQHFSNSEQIILFTIIQEIIQNAIKHSQSTDIYLILVFEDEKYSVKVVDNGIGMPADYTNGMGIYNIEKNVQLLNGTIKMYNDNGLTVEITLN